MNGARPRLPLTVIGGFLGAGKTTLLNRLLADAGGRRLAVLVNDFGSINIDAALIASSDGDTVALTNGCVCCSIGDDLTDALIGVIEAPVPFDAVVIEASGVSDPWRIAQVGLADPALMLDSVLVLVDASAVLEQAADPLLADSLARQVRSADFIVMNKCDLASEAQLDGVRAWIGLHAASTAVFETREAVVPMEVLRGLAIEDAVVHRATRGDPNGAQGRGGGHGDTDDGDTRSNAGDHSQTRTYTRRGSGSDGHGPTPGHSHRHDTHHDHDHDHGHPHDHAAEFDTWSMRPASPLPAARLRALLKAMPSGVLRLKGIVPTDEHGWAEIQFAGRHGAIRKATAASANGAAVVAIGLHGKLPIGALQEAFGAAH